MNCPRCQHENPPGMKFCGECAAPLAAICQSCGAANPPENKFCGRCAAPLRTTPTAKFGVPDSFTPKHLAEKILTSKAALEGERKRVTVLFADLKGSMELLAERDPEEARKLLDPVLERMMEAVHRYEGTVNQVMGDGIMALFGAPLAHEDHAVRACYAALRMQEAIGRYGNAIQRSHDVPIQIRVGLNSGEVVVRSLGSDLRMDYTAVGQTTHLAARMEQMAKPGSILLAPDTLRLAEGYIQVSRLGPVTVKGLPEPVEVYELIGAGQARTRLQATALRGLTHFVGRGAEVEHLRRVLTQASAGHGQVVAIVGEAGVGKSRLVYEFTHSHRVRDWLILEARSVSYGKATSYLPVIDLLKGYCKIGDRDDHREMRAKVLGRVLGLDRALEPLLPPLLALLDIPVEDPAWETLDPPQRRQGTLDAVKRLLLRESQVQPLLVVFEDLHWVDGETQALLDGLVETLGSARLLLLVNYRPEYAHRWGSKTAYSQLRLDALPAESTAELLAALLGPDPGLVPLTQRLVKRGNPFFLEETVRTLVETGALAGERGAYRLTRPVEALQVPATVQTILAARIDRLAPEDKRLLQTASVIGKDVPFPLLQAVISLPDQTLQHALARLQAAEFLYETRLFPDLEYTFKHALTHEVAYTSLLHERRRALHAKIVDALERTEPDRLTERVESLALHAVRGEAWSRAAAYLRQAGVRALSRSLAREATACFDQALSALEHLPESRETLEQAVDLRLDLRGALFRLGELSREGETLREAERLADTLGDDRRSGLVACAVGHHFWITGTLDRALAATQKAVLIAERLGDPGLELAAHLYLGQAHFTHGDYQRALAVLAASLEAFRRRRDAPTILGVSAYVWSAWSCAHQGAFADASVLAQEAVRIAETSAQPFSLVHAYCALGLVHASQGDAGRALTILERSLEFSQLTEIPIMFPLIALPLGLAYIVAGRPLDAIPVMDRALAEADAMGIGNDRAARLAYLGEAHLMAGHVDVAGPLADKALDLAKKHGERGHEGWCLRLLGEVAAHPEHLEVGATEAHYRRAIALGEELGMRPLVAHCHLGLGKLYRRTGKRDQAREHLTTATTMYREMGMTYWLEQAEAERHRLD